jgi:hypothetical protein
MFSIFMPIFFLRVCVEVSFFTFKLLAQIITCTIPDRIQSSEDEELVLEKNTSE